ncbi:MAG: hypothetical protein EOO38_22580, partial [Cytophagaceae bacterium]
MAAEVGRIEPRRYGAEGSASWSAARYLRSVSDSTVNDMHAAGDSSLQELADAGYAHGESRNQRKGFKHSYRQAIAIFTDNAIQLISSRAGRSRAECFRVFLLFLACVGILATEHRLSVANLLAAIPAMLFAGTARALRTYAVQHYPVQSLDRHGELWWLLVAGYAISIIWILCFWPDIRLVTVDVGHVPLLALNAALTAGSLLSGISIVLPIEMKDPEETLQSPDSKSYDTRGGLALLAVVGVVGSYSTLTV